MNLARKRAGTIFWVWHFFFFMLLLAGLFWIYQPVLGAPFVFDSAINIIDGACRFLDESHFPMQRWLMSWSFALHQEPFGNDPFWFRLPNLVLHAINGLLIARVGSGLVRTEDHQFPKFKAEVISYFAALFFVFHPVTTYGVAYAIQRSILLATLFCLLAVCFWLKGILDDRRRWYYVACVCYFLALASKEHAILLPFALICVTYAASAERRHFVKMVLPSVLMGMIGLYKVFEVQEILGQVYEPYALVARSLSTGESLMDSRLAYLKSVMMQAHLFFKYVLLWILPLDRWLAIDLQMPFPEVFPSWPEALGMCGYFMLPVFMVWGALKYRHWRALCFMLLVPWVLFGTEFAAVRFHENFVLYRSYLWMGMGAGTLPLLLKRFWKWPWIGGLVLIMVLMGFGLQSRVMTFASPLAVWEDAVKKLDRDVPVSRLPQANRMLSNYGRFLAEAGRYEESLSAYQDAIRYLPRQGKSHCGAGAALAFLKRYKEAKTELETCRDLSPDYEQAPYNLANVLVILGQTELAEQGFLKAIELHPARATDAMFNLANLYLRQKRFDLARRYYREYLRYRPQDAQARDRLNFLESLEP